MQDFDAIELKLKQLIFPIENKILQLENNL